jgi:hypothetical protein
LKLKFEELLSDFGFKFKLRRYKLEREELIRWFEHMDHVLQHTRVPVEQLHGRGLRSSTFQLNLSGL